jgi:general secretion pathway protein M
VNFKSWWENLADRERQIASVGAMFVGILVMYALIWSPLSDVVADRKMQVTTHRQVLQYLQHASQTIAQLKAQGVVVDAQGNIDLLSLVEQTLSQQGLSTYLKQVQQPQQKQVNLIFENVPFDKLMQWLQMMMQHGVDVQHFSATKLPAAGTAAVNMTLVSTE